ncbi:uncharacterized protein AB675_5481 [Cyphellophora attinorum]|uniref:CENP-V/GFA domain-containing protein n=1 Tax=Cyphellophora attinorum TaxID=1664694 RepID=A0A0N1HT35_9EURO|nr:uncharacterized protein AB675_5481 [Phialophora attinorum]KPI42014.1 hypothetical protein AB675_5481 [Phialophora attinorum]
MTSTTMRGHCNCKRINITIADKPPSELNTAVCHCRNCHRQGGSIIMLLATDDVVIEGEIKAYVDHDTDSGQPVTRYFCDNCGTPVISTTPVYEGKRIVKMNLFDDFPAPQVEIFTRSRRSYPAPIEGALVTFPGNAEAPAQS